MNVVAVPLAEKSALRNPPAAGTRIAVAKVENEAVRFAVPGSNAEPEPSKVVEPVIDPLA
jgi:hypothetical protein